MSLLHWAVFTPFLFAIVVPFLYKLKKSIHTGWFVLIVPVTLFLYFIQFLGQISSKENIIANFPWIPSLGINFTVYLDGLSLLFALLITGIGSLVVLYSIYYLSKHKESLHNFYVYLLLFLGAMLGVVLSDNLIVLYMFWEFTSLSSFLLIAYWYQREKSRYGAQKSMLITVFGGFSMLAGFIFLYIMSGTLSVREIISQVPMITDHSLFIPALLLVLLGAFTKSAQFPFHIWLPDAMEAPTPVSAYLHSATMVKAGIYLVARLTPVFAGTPEWLWLISAFGVVTLFWGSFSAVKQTDLKSILAFSTVSQLGMIMALLGIGSAAFYFDAIDEKLHTIAVMAAVFHLINHATFKGCLFMVVGIIDHETGTRDIRKLGGLMSVMPISFTLAIIGSFSMAGLPPFNGFLSKEMFFTGMLAATSLDIFNLQTWGILFPVLAWLGSIFTFIYSMVLVFKTFTGKYQPEKLDTKPHEAPIGMLIPPIVLASLVIIFGLFPNILAYSLIEPAMSSILYGLKDPGEYFKVDIYFWHGFTLELFMTMGVFILGVLLFLYLRKWNHIYEKFPQKLALNHFYDSGLVGVERFSTRFTDLYMTGVMRHYLTYIFAFFIVCLGSYMYILDAFKLDLTSAAPVGIYEIILALLLVVSSFVIILSQSRLTAIIALGVVGYTVALFFVIFRAPDLALTQLIVETISVALFLLCFYFLPDLKREKKRIKLKIPNLIISIGVGTIVTLISLSAHSSKMLESISSYFVEESYNSAGGKNMVNVILVDFRGFDTMFEIAVLVIAALGIFSMIKLRLARRNEG